MYCSLTKEGPYAVDLTLDPKRRVGWYLRHQYCGMQSNSKWCILYYAQHPALSTLYQWNSAAM